MVQKQSTLKFIYPFSFSHELIFKINKDIWDEDYFFPKDEVLLHISKYINPPDQENITALLLRLKDPFLTGKDFLGANCEWFLQISKEKLIPFELRGIQLSLFLSNVGFLVIEARPKSNELSDWFDFVHYFRFFKKNGTEGRSKEIIVRERAGIDKITHEPIYKPYFSPLAGGLSTHPEGKGNIKDIINALLLKIQSKKWWEDIYIPGQMLPYAILFLNNVPESDRHYILYRIKNFFHSRQEIHPSQYDLSPESPHLLPYTENSWFTFSLDGGSFVFFDAPSTPFFMDTLPAHLVSHYFFLFLIALQQRFALITLSQLVADFSIEKDEQKKLAIFSQIRERLLIFTARCLFAQVFQRAHHHRSYLKWQEIFQIDKLYNEVRDEVQDMYSFERERLAKEEEKRDKQLEKRINILVLLIGIPSLIFTILDINITGLTSSGISLVRVIMIGILGSLIFGVLLWTFFLSENSKVRSILKFFKKKLKF